MPNLTANTRVLVSFGARSGGMEFVMQLRYDIYKKFGRSPSADPGFCYLDAESLRSESKTKYKYDTATDTNFMSNPEWDSYYDSAMNYCRTMILLITKQWLESEWCWKELEMLVSKAEKKPDLRVIVVYWPDAQELMQKNSWPDRNKGKTNGVSYTPQQFNRRIQKFRNIFALNVSGQQPPIIGQLMATGASGLSALTPRGGENTFAYSLSEAESNLILANINA
jgi:TIR domain